MDAGKPAKSVRKAVKTTVEGVAATNLVAGTTYYVYAFNNAGVVTADFSTTAHVTDSTDGNIGTEIKFGDTTRTLIGMIRTAGLGEFIDDATFHGVLSWFNRRAIGMQKITSIPMFSTTPVGLTTGLFFLAWEGASIAGTVDGYATAGTAPGIAYVNIQLQLNSVAVGMAVNASNAFGLYATYSTSYHGPVPEGLSAFNVLGASATGDVQQCDFIVSASTAG